MGQLVLGQVALPLDAEHDLDLLGVPAAHAGAHHPVEVALRLVAARRGGEGAPDHRGVAQPREAVVEVRVPAGDFGERSGGRGDDGTAGLVGEALDHDAREAHGLGVCALVAVVELAP